MSVIETAGLGKRYRRTWAVRDCTLAIPAGRVAALVGPNGAGKTTLMHMAVGLTRPTAGSVTVVGLMAATMVDRPLPAGGSGRLARPFWRQHRAGLTGFAVVCGVAAAVMLAAGLLGHDHYAALARDHCLGSRQPARCRPLLGDFPWLANANYPLQLVLAARVVPVLAGLFLGAPALAREYERGTARFAWTQGTSRTRWTLASLVTLGVPVVVISAGLGALATWSLLPFETLRQASRWPGPFDSTPLTLAAWSLLAFLVGVTAGAAFRHVVPAMAVAGGTATALVLVNVWKLHGLLLQAGAVVTRTRLLADQFHAQPPTGDTQFFSGGSVVRAPAGSWILDGWFENRSGHRLTGAALAPLSALKAPQQQAWLASHDASVWISYQPGGHYWALQGLECGVLLALAVVLVAVAVFLVRRSSP